MIAAEAKLVGPLSVLVWLLPLIFVAELVLAANGLISEVSFGGPVASVLETLIRVLFFMFVVRMIERQLEAARKDFRGRYRRLSRSLEDRCGVLPRDG